MDTVERKRIRNNFGKQKDVIDIPNLFDNKVRSYDSFLQRYTHFSSRKDMGIHSVLTSIFPVENDSGLSELSYIKYRLGNPFFTIDECIKRGLSYTLPIHVLIRLTIFNKDKTVKSVEEEEVFFGDIPLITPSGLFIINGITKIVVSQLHRAPGLFFYTSQESDSVSYSTKLVPYIGAWLSIEVHKEVMWVRIDNRKKIPVSLFLRALGLTNEDMITKFTESYKYYLGESKCKLVVSSHLIGRKAPKDLFCDGELVIKEGKTVTEKHFNKLKGIKTIGLPIKDLLGRHLSRPVIKGGETLAHANDELTSYMLDYLLSKGIKTVDLFDASDSIRCLSNAIKVDNTSTEEGALIEIYSIFRPEEPATYTTALSFLYSLFFDSTRYDLSLVGRMKLNTKLKYESLEGPSTVSKEDIFNIVKEFLNFQDSNTLGDDIDHLSNRRIREVGEMVENQFKQGAVKMLRAALPLLDQARSDPLSPKEILDSRIISISLRDFFSINPLCQFADQINPVSQIAHNRRISSLGIGGLAKDRADVDVRDVHPTYYGRLCPIESPEGPNVGLINSLALYARTNKYGMLETPYRKVENRLITNKIDYLSSIDEGKFVIAQSSVPLDENKLIVEGYVATRYNDTPILEHSSKVDYIDVSSKQIVSVAASMIPFMEHDDSKRALMGANMQRQAVPVLKPQAPLVGTGIERIVARDSGATVVSNSEGIVKYVDSSKVMILTSMKTVETYNLIKYKRSNQSTCVNQKPIVNIGDSVKKGTILADGPSTDMGEIALGQNILVAFMPWNGYNYEDAILISEKIVKDDRFTSIHIEEFVCIAQDLKGGPEEITIDIPNVSERSLVHLDTSGIVTVGTSVKAGDILVGKVTPKADVAPASAEEKLVYAIFGEKALSVKDTSLRVPLNYEGVVIDVQVLSRDIFDEAVRAAHIREFEDYKRDIDGSYTVIKENLYAKMYDFLLGRTYTVEGVRKIVTLKYLNSLKRSALFEIPLTNKEDRKALRSFKATLNDSKAILIKKLQLKKKKIGMTSGMAPKVVKVVKVFLAIKRIIQPGDKLAGRHGNKGVISIIKPVEDMPYLEDGTPIDIVLNPLGVPSRMNVGQVLETHLGWAAKGLGDKLQKMITSQKKVSKLRKFLGKIYNYSGQSIDLNSLSDEEILELVNNLTQGVPMATPVFDGAKEIEIREMLSLADLPTCGQTYLYDGLTGEQFERPVTVGYMYIMKLNHLVEDKMHARSTGPYSMITQQPLGGKAQKGGQRLGEMEVWALQAYGASYTLQEMLTVKSDDIVGRDSMYKNILDNNLVLDSNIPESFNVLIQELRALALDIRLGE